MSDPQKLREVNWRRPLTRSEDAELRASIAETPEVHADLEFENQLTLALNGLADVPVSSNFTARVLQAVESGNRASSRQGRGGFHWRSWFPKLAIGSSVLCAGLLLFHQQRLAARIERAQSVAAISRVAPAPELLKNFQVISQMSRPPLPTQVPPDEDLLALEPLLAQIQ